MIRSRTRDDHMARRYHDSWRLVLRGFIIYPVGLISLGSDMIECGVWGPCWMSLNRACLEGEIESVSERFVVRCQLESSDSGMSRDDALWRIRVWLEQSADSGDVTFYDQHCAITVSREKHKRYCDKPNFFSVKTQSINSTECQTN